MLFEPSPKYRTPAAEMARKREPEKRAAVPTPLTNPLVDEFAPPPAMTETLPVGEIRRMRLFVNSETKT